MRFPLLLSPFPPFAPAPQIENSRRNPLLLPLPFPLSTHAGRFATLKKRVFSFPPFFPFLPRSFGRSRGIQIATPHTACCELFFSSLSLFSPFQLRRSGPGDQKKTHSQLRNEEKATLLLSLPSFFFFFFFFFFFLSFPSDLDTCPERTSKIGSWRATPFSFSFPPPSPPLGLSVSAARGAREEAIKKNCRHPSSSFFPFSPFLFSFPLSSRAERATGRHKGPDFPLPFFSSFSPPSPPFFPFPLFTVIEGADEASS